MKIDLEALAQKIRAALSELPVSDINVVVDEYSDSIHASAKPHDETGYRRLGLLVRLHP